MKVVLAALVLLAAAGCAEEQEPPRPTSSTGSSGSFGLGGHDYVRDMEGRIEDGNEIIADFNDLVAIWEATFNVEYATAQTRSLLSQTRALLSSVRRLTPPDRYRDAHQLFLDTFTAMKSVLEHFLIHVTTSDPDLKESAILNANIELRKAIRLRDQFNEEIES